MRAKIFLLLYLFLFPFMATYSESVHTELTDPKHIEIFHEVTSKIRCICLPSLPIKGCSYNNCVVSAYIKKFIENQIQKGENAKSIIHKMQYGFGEGIKIDPIVEHFISSGNENIVRGLVFGFGETILADPDSTGVNVTIVIGIAVASILMGFYLKKRIFRHLEYLIDKRVSWLSFSCKIVIQG